MNINGKLRGHISLALARIFSGLNINAMKFLLPLWIAPLSCVLVRLLFGTLLFWTIGLFEKKETVSALDKVKLLLLGAVGIFGYMSLYAVGLSLTTPVSLAVFNAMQPIWVFVISAIFLHEKITNGKIIGILAGFGGAALCALSQPDDNMASNPHIGNLLGFLCSICYASYIVLSAGILKRVGNITMLRYTFSGALASSLIVSCFTGFDTRMFHVPYNVEPMIVFAFVLLFPTFFTYLLIPVGLRFLRPTVVSVYGYLTLFVATIVSLLLGTDRFDIMQIMSLLLICYSIYKVSLAENRF